MNKRDAKAIARKMSRNQCQELLKAFGFAVYDGEAVRDLRSAIVENIEDGTIPSLCLADYQ